MILKWQNDWGMSRMRSEWNKRVLSLYKRQQPFISFWPHSASFLSHSKKYECQCQFQTNKQWYLNDRMIQEWAEWGLNEINGCCLFIRDSSRLFHSDLILTSFLCHSINLRSCPEWFWNDRMMVGWQVFQNPIFRWPKKSPSFLIIRSFLNEQGMKNTMEIFHLRIIPFI